MAEMTKMTGGSKDLVAERMDALKKLVPEAFAEGKIDFDALKGALGDAVDSSKEHYRFTWNGKEEARAFALRPSMGTLRPCEAESSGKDGTEGKFDSENLYIEGDNLEVLKLLQGAYHNAVKMIYIDPPYNTGHDFVYADDFSDSLKNYKQLTGQSDGEGRATHANAETSGRYHTDWLNMMFPRLLLARNLLREDGVIFISIDDNEYANLKKLGDEVFGENNFIATFLWTKTSTPPALSQKCRKTVEYVLVYEKSRSAQKYFGAFLDNGDAPLLNTGNSPRTLKFPAGTVKFLYANDGLIKASRFERATLEDDVLVKNGVNEKDFRLTAEFKWDQDNLNAEVNKGTYFLIKSQSYSIRFQRVGNVDDYKTPTNFIELNKTVGVGTNESASTELEELGMGGVFDYPKPTTLLKKLISMVCHDCEDGITLDFFSGSASFAHAIMDWDLTHIKSNKYVLVQLPEDLDSALRIADAASRSQIEKAIQFCDVQKVKHNICEIGKERIRRAGRKIVEELKKKVEVEESKSKSGGDDLFAEVRGAAGVRALPENPVNPVNPVEKTLPDIGFKVFKLDTSNLIPWNPNPDDLKASLLAVVDNAVEGRTADDLLYEILLKCNLPLTLAVEKKAFGANTIAVVGEGALMICLDKTITASVAEEMVRLRDEVYKPAVAMQVVFRDGGFTDKEKANAIATLVQAGVEERAILSI